jgi:hypothetical protein
LDDSIQTDQKVPMTKCSGIPKSRDVTGSVQKVPKAKGIVACKLSAARRHGQKVPKGELRAPGK